MQQIEGTRATQEDRKEPLVHIRELESRIQEQQKEGVPDWLFTNKKLQEL